MTQELVYKNRTYTKGTPAPILVSGICYYSKIGVPDKGGKTTSGQKIDPSYSISVIPDEESKEILEFLEVRMKPANDAIPGDHIQPRVTVKAIEQAEALGKKGPKKPILQDANKNPLDVPVGNGSKVTVVMYAIPGQYGLPNLVCVDELVEYIAPEDREEDLISYSYRLVEESDVSSTEDLNDDLPAEMQDDTPDQVLAAG